MENSRKLLLWTNVVVLIGLSYWLYLRFASQIALNRELAKLESSSKLNIVIAGQNNSNHTCVFELLTGTRVSEEDYQVVDTATERYILIPALNRVEFDRFDRAASLLKKTLQRAKGPFKLVYVVRTTEGRINTGQYSQLENILATIHDPSTPYGFIITKPAEKMKNSYSCVEGVIRRTFYNTDTKKDEEYPKEEQLTFMQILNADDSYVSPVGKMRAHACLAGCKDTNPADDNGQTTKADKTVLRELLTRLPSFTVDPSKITRM